MAILRTSAWRWHKFCAFFFVALAALFCACSAKPSAKAPQTKRVFLIGLDGASWNLMEPALRRGKLPHIQKLIETGTTASLKSMLPAHSPVLWTTIATGKTQLKHGIGSFTAEKDGQMIPVSGSQRITKAFWNILSDYKIRTGVVNWWVTWPPEKIDGFMISDRYRNWNAHTKDMVVTSPPELLNELPKVGITQKQFEAERVEFGLPADLHPQSRVQTLEGLAGGYKTYWSHDRAIRESCRRMLDSHPVDVFAVVFRIVDVSSHVFSGLLEPKMMSRAGLQEASGELSQSEINRIDEKFAELLEPVYIYADSIVGDFVQHAGSGDNVIICSDHGFRLDHGRYGHANMDPPPDGILILNGPAFKKGHRLLEASLIDITPTLMQVENLPTGRDMDGKILLDAFDPAFLKAHPSSQVASHDKGYRQNENASPSEMDKEILDDLKTLGYIQ